MTKQRIKNTLMNRCKCCLRERPSKDMWDEHNYHGGTENYGILLTNCFQLPWHEPLSGTERICFICIGRLRDAVSFKSQIMDAQKFKSELLNDALRLDDVADIEQKIQEFLEKNLSITVAFEQQTQRTHRSNSYFKETNPITNIAQEQYEESMLNESDTDEHDNQEDNSLETDNNYEEKNNILIEYLDEMETGNEKKTTNEQERDIKVELFTQVDADNRQVIILGNTIIKNKNQDTNKYLEQTESAQELDTLTEAAAESEPTQDSQQESETTSCKEPPVSCKANHEDNSALSDLNDEEQDYKHAKRTNYQYKMPWNKHIRRNYLIERTKHQENLVSLLLSTDATPVRCKTDKGYQCGFCETHFYDPSELRTHTHGSHGKEEKTKYMAETSLTELIVRLDITDLHCVKCYTSLQDLDTAWSHLQNHGIKIHTDIKNQIAPFIFKGELLECVVCHESMPFRGLMKHMNSHYGNVVCDQCGEGFICKRLLDSHTREHEDGDFQCAHCPKQFTCRKKWMVHKNLVHDNRKALRVVCGVCGDRFATGFQKRKHLELVHNAPAPDTSGFECQQCGKILYTKKTLKLHILNLHQKMKRYQCDRCDKECFDSTSMKRHIEVHHLKYAGLECSRCSKAFKSEKKLKRHMRFHESDKIYNCKYCNEHFLTASGRQSHLRAKHDSAPNEVKTRRSVNASENPHNLREKHNSVGNKVKTIHNVNAPENPQPEMMNIEELS